MSIRCEAPGCLTDVWRPGWACEVCWDYRTTHRDTLPEAWLATHAQLVPGAGRRDESLGQISVSKAGSSAPLRMDALHALEYAVGLVTRWTDILADVGYVERLPAGARDGWLIEKGTARLAAGDFYFEETSYAAGYVRALNHLHQRFRRVADPASSPLHLHIACPHCGRLTLVQRNADVHVACLTCHAQWSEARWSVAVRATSLRGANLTSKARAATRVRPSVHGRKRS